MVLCCARLKQLHMMPGEQEEDKRGEEAEEEAAKERVAEEEDCECVRQV